MKRDDYVLFYQSKHYTYVAQVLETADNETFATNLWERDATATHGSTYIF